MSIQTSDVTSIILTSAVVSAVVTSILNLFAQYFERRSKNKELLFTKCVELAKTKTEFLMKFAENTGKAAFIADFVVYAEVYHWLLGEIHDHGKLPQDWHAKSKKLYGLDLFR